jgi:hypothetical protein
VESKSGTRLTGRTSDLGLGGCYVDTLSPFPVGSNLHVRIVRKNETFEAQARVVYSANGLGMGLAFVSAQPRQVRLFQRWLLEISGQETPTLEEAPPQPAPAATTAATETTQSLMKSAVLTELIMTLMKKKVLTDMEGKELLRKMFA